MIKPNQTKHIGSNKKILIFCLTIFLFLVYLPANDESQSSLLFPITYFKLKNGLHVILSEDNSLPIVSVVVAYNVGSINEKPGKTGLAYLLENLMFQGSRNISRMQHIIFINKTGGELNAATLEDKTIYYQTVPSNQLALVLWLESDRMKYLEITDSKVERGKNSLIEEIQHRKATDPYFESFFAFDKLIFPDFSLSHPVIGKEEDIREITANDVKNFYSTFYTPNNAVLCVVGNIDKIKAEELIKKYFESIPKGKEVPFIPVPESLEKKSANEIIEDSLAPLPGFHLGYRIAYPYSDDFYTLTILEYILLKGKSSRLYKRLYKKERIVSDYNGGIETRKNFAVFELFFLGNNEIMVNRIQKAVFSEINKLKLTRLSEKELTKSKNMFKMDYIKQYSTSLGKALFLTETFLSRITLDDLPLELNKYLKVTPTDIIGVVNKYFIPDNRIILYIKIK